MKTLNELNETVWYKLIKVLCIILYFPLLFFVIRDFGKVDDYIWSVTKGVISGLIFTIGYILIMEFLRRCLYYILIGKVFPKELSFKMTTLQELNNKPWYRFLKVLYVLCYLIYFGILIFIINQNLKTYQERSLPRTVQEVLKDPEFYKLDDNDKSDVLSSFGDESQGSYLDRLSVDKQYLKPDEIKLIIENLKSQSIPTTPLKGKYVYSSHYTWNIAFCIYLGLIFTLCWVLVMEFIKRSFYYVLIGKIFPKE